MTRRISPASVLVASLRDEPELWTFDRYRARHKRGVVLWIANGWTALSFDRFEGNSPAPGLGCLARIRLWRAITRRRDADFARLLTPQVPGESSRED